MHHRAWDGEDIITILLSCLPGHRIHTYGKLDASQHDSQFHHHRLDDSASSSSSSDDEGEPTGVAVHFVDATLPGPRLQQCPAPAPSAETPAASSGKEVAGTGIAVSHASGSSVGPSAAAGAREEVENLKAKQVSGSIGVVPLPSSCQSGASRHDSPEPQLVVAPASTMVLAGGKADTEKEARHLAAEGPEAVAGPQDRQAAEGPYLAHPAAPSVPVSGVEDEDDLGVDTQVPLTQELQARRQRRAAAAMCAIKRHSLLLASGSNAGALAKGDQAAPDVRPAEGLAPCALESLPAGLPALTGVGTASHEPSAAACVGGPALPVQPPAAAPQQLAKRQHQAPLVIPAQQLTEQQQLEQHQHSNRRSASPAPSPLPGALPLKRTHGVSGLFAPDSKRRAAAAAALPSASVQPSGVQGTGFCTPPASPMAMRSPAPGGHAFAPRLGKQPCFHEEQQQGKLQMSAQGQPVSDVQLSGWREAVARLQAPGAWHAVKVRLKTLIRTSSCLSSVKSHMSFGKGGLRVYIDLDLRAADMRRFNASHTILLHAGRRAD